MIEPNNEIKFIVSRIKGYELKIIMILQKYIKSEREIDNIMDIVALIESDTIKLVQEKGQYETYNMKVKKADDVKPKVERRGRPRKERSKA